MKEIEFLGSSRKQLQGFPENARRKAGYELRQLQLGAIPEDFKPMPSIGPGVEEMRIWDTDGTFRIIYFARLEDAVYVLHAFQKKSQATQQRDIKTRTQTTEHTIGRKEGSMKRERFANVWDALCDTPEESANLTARSDLMIQIGQIVKKSGWTQAEAARRCNVTQPRINDLLRGRIDRFSLDALVNIATALGRKVQIKLKAA